jgi:hypothetical protein
MFNAFLFSTTGWGDLIGILNLMIWTTLGLVAGLVIQLAAYLFSKQKKKV